MGYPTPLNDKRAMLRVKLKSLAAEAAFIRIEEQRARKRFKLRDELHNHRVVKVRWEARCTHLAYGLIKGRTLAQLEAKTLEPYSDTLKQHVDRMVRFYGPTPRLALPAELNPAKKA